MHMSTAKHDRCRFILSPWLRCEPLDYRKQSTKCVMAAGRSGRPLSGGTLATSRGNLAVQLVQRRAHAIQHVLTPRCQTIDPGSFRPLRLGGANPPVSLHARENRIERAWTHAVPVVAQLVEHPLAVHASRFGGVVEDVDFPETQQELTDDRIAH